MGELLAAATLEPKELEMALDDFATLASLLTGAVGVRIELTGFPTATLGDLDPKLASAVHPIGTHGVLSLFGGRPSDQRVEPLLRRLVGLVQERAIRTDTIRRHTNAITLAERANDIARAAARRFEALFDGLPVACFACDGEGRLMEWNRAAEALWGDSIAAGWGEDAASITAPDNIDPERAILKRVLAGETVRDRIRSLDANGTQRWLLVCTFPLRDGNEQVVGALAAHLDITDQKAFQDQLAEREARFRTVVQALHEGLVVVDPQGKVLLRNLSAGRILGREGEVETLTDDFPADSAINQLGQPIAVEDWPMNAALRTGQSVKNMLLGMRRPGTSEKLWLSFNAEPLFYEGHASPVAAVATFTDVSARLRQQAEIEAYSAELEAQREVLARANARLERLATTDGLTGLRNHRAFQESIATELRLARRSGRALSLILLDVDRFKDYNDSFGHPAGDEVLREVANALLETARATDIAARYGGEEFALVLPDTDFHGALEAAERFRAAIAERNWPHRPVTASLGVASLMPGDRESASLVSRADRGLYAAKAGGRNRVAAVDYGDAEQRTAA